MLPSLLRYLVCRKNTLSPPLNTILSNFENPNYTTPTTTDGVVPLYSPTSHRTRTIIVCRIEIRRKIIGRKNIEVGPTTFQFDFRRKNSSSREDPAGRSGSVDDDIKKNVGTSTKDIFPCTVEIRCFFCSR